MERRSFVRGAGLAGAVAGIGALAAACGKKQEAAAPVTPLPAAPAPTPTAPAVVTSPTIRWRLASSFPKALDTIYGASEVFAKKVGEMSGGKFEISVHAGGELMPAFGVVDGVQNGTVEMAHTAPYYFFGKDETFALGCAIPFGLNSRQMTAWMVDGNGLKLMREFYARYNIINFPGGNTGAQMGGWYRRELKTLADMKGLKFRVGGFAGKVIERMGGIPQNIPGGEIYQALEKGTIDAAEWVSPVDDLKLGFVKVAPFYHYPAWWEGGPQLDFYINSKAWDALTSDYKAMVETAASHAHVEMQARYDARNPAALKQLVSQGAKVVPIPKPIIDVAFEESMALYAEVSARNTSWKKVYDDMAAFRREANLWFRFTEARFDNYMQAAKL